MLAPPMLECRLLQARTNHPLIQCSSQCIYHIVELECPLCIASRDSLYRLGFALTICLCLFNQLFGASCLRCSTTWLLCNRPVISYQALAIRAFSRVRFLIVVSLAAFTFFISFQRSKQRGKSSFRKANKMTNRSTLRDMIKSQWIIILNM